MQKQSQNHPHILIAYHLYVRAPPDRKLFNHDERMFRINTLHWRNNLGSLHT